QHQGLSELLDSEREDDPGTGQETRSQKRFGFCEAQRRDADARHDATAKSHAPDWPQMARAESRHVVLTSESRDEGRDQATSPPRALAPGGRVRLPEAPARSRSRARTSS